MCWIPRWERQWSTSSLPTRASTTAPWSGSDGWSNCYSRTARAGTRSRQQHSERRRRSIGGGCLLFEVERSARRIEQRELFVEAINLGPAPVNIHVDR